MSLSERFWHLLHWRWDRRGCAILWFMDSRGINLLLGSLWNWHRLFLLFFVIILNLWINWVKIFIIIIFILVQIIATLIFSIRFDWAKKWISCGCQVALCSTGLLLSFGSESTFLSTLINCRRCTISILIDRTSCIINIRFGRISGIRDLRCDFTLVGLIFCWFGSPIRIILRPLSCTRQHFKATVKVR